MSYYTFGYRSSIRPLLQQSLLDQDWFDTNMLAYIFGNTPVFTECGGLYGLAYGLRSSLHTGLPADEAADNYSTRKSLYGTNSIPPLPVQTLLTHFLSVLTDPLLIILMLAGVASLCVNTLHNPQVGWLEGLGIFSSVLAVVNITAWTNWSQDRELAHLAQESLSGSPVTVLRQGKLVSIPMDELLVGDVIMLFPGQIIPADGVLIDNTDVYVDESLLPHRQHKVLKSSTHSPFLLSGSIILENTCAMLTTAVGLNSTRGRLLFPSHISAQATSFYQLNKEDKKLHTDQIYATYLQQQSQQQPYYSPPSSSPSPSDSAVSSRSGSFATSIVPPSAIALQRTVCCCCCRRAPPSSRYSTDLQDLSTTPEDDYIPSALELTTVTPLSFAATANSALNMKQQQALGQHPQFIVNVEEQNEEDSDKLRHRLPSVQELQQEQQANAGNYIDQQQQQQSHMVSSSNSNFVAAPAAGAASNRRRSKLSHANPYASGSIGLSFSQVYRQTALQRRLYKLSHYITYVGFVTSFVIFLGLTIHYVISIDLSQPHHVGENGQLADILEELWLACTQLVNSVLWYHIIDFSILALSILILTFPESLPLALTVSLTYTMKRMAGNNAYIKTLRACDKIGQMSSLCTDKTNVLTKMFPDIAAIQLGGHVWQRQPRREEIPVLFQDLLFDTIICNSTQYTFEKSRKYFQSFHIVANEADDNDEEQQQSPSHGDLSGFGNASLAASALSGSKAPSSSSSTALASSRHRSSTTTSGPAWEWVMCDGGPTETALLTWFTSYYFTQPTAHHNIMTLRAKEADRIVSFRPYDHITKTTSIIMQQPDFSLQNNNHNNSNNSTSTTTASSSSSYSAPSTNARQYYKGDGEYILRGCNRVLQLDGTVRTSASLDLPRCVATGCHRTAMRGETPQSPTYCALHSSVNDNFAYDGVCRYVDPHSGKACCKFALMGPVVGQYDPLHPILPLYCENPLHHPIEARFPDTLQSQTVSTTSTIQSTPSTSPTSTLRQLDTDGVLISQQDMQLSGENSPVQVELATIPAASSIATNPIADSGDTMTATAAAAAEAEAEATTATPSLPITSSFVLLDQHPLKLMLNLQLEGHTTVAFAYADNIPLMFHNGKFQNFHNGDMFYGQWTLIGFAALDNVIQEEAKLSVACAQQAGIIVRLLAEDALNTSESIAQKCGILTSPKHHVALTSLQFRHLLDQHVKFRLQHNGQCSSQFITTLRNIRVISSCQPQDRIDFVAALQQYTDEVVAVIGDTTVAHKGCLESADLAISLGITGSDVIKNISDIVLLDDAFSTVIDCVLWARNMFDNLRKFIQFQGAVTLSTLLFSALAVLHNGASPLSAIQLLWINLMIDTVGALSLTTDSAEPFANQILTRYPYHSKTSFISWYMWKNIIGQAITQFFILEFVLHWMTNLGGSHWWGVPGTPSYQELNHYTFLFNVYVFCQFFNAINSRGIHSNYWKVFVGIGENPIFILLLSLIIVKQLTFVECFGIFTDTTSHQSLTMWLASILLGATQLLTGFLWHLIPSSRYEGQRIPPEHAFEGAFWRADSIEDQIYPPVCIDNNPQLRRASSMRPSVENGDNDDQQTMTRFPTTMFSSSTTVLRSALQRLRQDDEDAASGLHHEQQDGVLVSRHSPVALAPADLATRNAELYLPQKLQKFRDRHKIVQYRERHERLLVKLQQKYTQRAIEHQKQLNRIQLLGGSMLSPGSPSTTADAHGLLNETFSGVYNTAGGHQQRPVFSFAAFIEAQNARIRNRALEKAASIASGSKSAYSDQTLQDKLHQTPHVTDVIASAARLDGVLCPQVPGLYVFESFPPQSL